jgi:hypothetical protein
LLPNRSKAKRIENLAATHVTPFTSMGPVSGALQEMFQAVRELSVAAFCKAPPQEKQIIRNTVRVERILGTMDSLVKINIVLLIISIFLLAGIYNYWLTGAFFFSF